MKSFFKIPKGLTVGKTIILGLQHTFTMFGATVLVPLLTGLDVSVALFMAGVSTLLFHFITGGKVPIFLGSSFAFIAPIILVNELYGMEYALGGIVLSGLTMIIFAFLIKLVGVKTIMEFFPPVVTGPIISIIGLMLAGVAITNATDNWFLAGISFSVVAVISIYGKGFIRLIPVICGIIVGYSVDIISNLVSSNLSTYASIGEQPFIAFPDFTLARFSLQAALIIVPVAIATAVEHIGDIIAAEEVTGKKFSEDPGLFRTMVADGIAETVSGMFGGPATTTYSENAGVLVLTKVFDPIVMRIAAIFAIILSMFPMIGEIIRLIPAGVIGGVSIILFGMIAALGFRILVENRVDFKDTRTLIIVAPIMVFGLGGAVFTFGNFELAGVGLAAIIGIALNKILPIKP